MCDPKVAGQQASVGAVSPVDVVIVLSFDFVIWAVLAVISWGCSSAKGPTSLSCRDGSAALYFPGISKVNILKHGARNPIAGGGGHTGRRADACSAVGKRREPD